MVRHGAWGGLSVVATTAPALNSKRIPWLGLIALVLLALAVAGLMKLPTVQQQALLQSLQSLLVWLPVLYGVVGLSYAGRYWRWRLLLGKLGIGSTNWPDWLGWFRRLCPNCHPRQGWRAEPGAAAA